MNSLFVLRTLLLAGECFFAASLILALSLALARGKAAAQRHLVWTAAFAAMLLLPVLAALVQTQVVFELPAAPAAAVAASVTAAPAPASHGIGAADVVRALAAVWLVGVVLILAKLAAGWIGLLLLQRRSVPHIPQGIDDRKFRDNAPRWELRIRTMPDQAGAMTWGVFKSTVLLPKSSVLWPRDRLEAVLLHEFAHVCRRDCLARLVALVACAFYWPNPFVWSAARLMRRDAEIAADDAVLGAGIRPSDYAEQLLNLAGPRTESAGVSLSMADPSTLKARVQTVLNPGQSRSGVTKMDVLKVAALGLAATAAFALARPSLAEAQQPQIATPAAPAIAVADDAAAPPIVPAPSDDSVRSAPPPADAAPFAPPVPPVPAVPPVPPLPSVGAIPPLPPLPHIDSSGFRRAMAARDAELRRAQAEIARAQEEVRKAVHDARISETVAKAMEQARLALENARKVNIVVIRQAADRAKVSEEAARDMQRLRPRIEIEIRKDAGEEPDHDEDDDR